jgi:hypothetical protein
VLGSNISGFEKLVHYLSVEHIAPKITLYGILFDVRVSSKMEKKIQPTSNFICIASSYKNKNVCNLCSLWVCTQSWVIE